MSLLFFQVPDLNPRTDGLASSTLELRGDQTTQDLVRLCRLLQIPLQRPIQSVYPTAFAQLSAWQRNHGLISDGVVGPFMWAMLERSNGGTLSGTSWLGLLPPERLCKLFPYTTRKNLQIYAPYVLAALDAAGYGPTSNTGRLMCQMALATIRAETEGFAPISEGQSRYNTPPGGAPFSLYDPGTDAAKKLGNTQLGDGDRFKGRGFVQLTGRDNYTTMGVKLGIELDKLPFLANYPDVAAVLLVRFLSLKETQIKAALAAKDEALARSLVNGGSHGLDRFSDTLNRWRDSIAPTLNLTPARRAAGLTVAKRVGTSGFVLPVKSDAVDLRDLPYRPPLRSLPPVWPADSVVKKFMPLYEQLKLVLNQGSEGACTGFGLASVVNYLRFSACATDVQRKKLIGVSPRMIYELARRYDEYEGNDYEGSSCRGALKGWHKHGVCFDSDWDYEKDLIPANSNWATHALQNTLGVYYRIDKSNLVDMQAAIADVGAIYVSAHAHDGWDLGRRPIAKGVKTPGHDELIQIAYTRDNNPRQGAHAFALVGYNSRGFIVQNSWGPTWGWNGFAMLRYDDWLDNGMDAWVAALGVPGVVNNAAVAGYQPLPARTRVSGASSRAGIALAGISQPPQALDARHSLVLDRGLAASASTRDTLQPNGLGELIAEWPRQWFEQWRHTHPGEPARLVIYAHGGLNSESEGRKRARYMAQPFLDNGCYPLFIVWKTGLMETLAALATQTKTVDGERAGNYLTDHVTDPVLEKLLHSPGQAVWHQIKHAAQVANGPEGGLTQLANSVQTLRAFVPDLEVHLVGHSAGSILLGPLVGALHKRRVPMASAHLYAPACTVGFANQYWLPYLGPRNSQKNTFPLYVSLLSDRLERQDNVALAGVLGYQKSLLYLVARSFEENTPTPLFGMEGAWDRTKLFGEWDNAADTLQALRDFDRSVADLEPIKALVRDAPFSNPMTFTWTDAAGQPVAAPHDEDLSATDRRVRTAHGSFDGDAVLALHTIERIRGGAALLRQIDLSKVP